jgi:SAM-dependent methyltransferase
LATFECADIFDLPAAFAGRRFDLVVLRLVLWSVGPDWQSALHVALSMLEPHGRLYSLEPDDALLVTYPENDAFNGNLKRWRERVQAAGCDPFIGRKVAHAVFGNGGEVVSLDLLMNVACAGAATGDYRAVVTNLEGLFCTEGDAVTHPLSRGPVAGTFVCEGLVATVAKTFNKGMET